MRSDCKHYQTRTYPSGDTMRKCGLDLAPKAPWECPADCSSYERRLADVAWNHGSLVTPATPDPPASVENDDSIAALLDSAEDIINAAGPIVRAEVDAEAEAERQARKKRSGRWWPFNR
ncbi:MAG: hypothetical protein ACN4GZ_05120 [Acidimicrobiales bacterium]